MKAVVLMLVVALALASHPVNEEIVASIREKTDLWTPHDVEDNKFSHYSEEALIAMMGTRIDEERDERLAKEMGITGIHDEVNADLPDSFDSREQWGDICPFPIKDQAHCGSCWAFGAVGAFQDRACIVSEGGFTERLSEQHMVSCDYVGLGCSGGWPLSAFGYLTLMGVPTEACQPYTSGETGSAWGCRSRCEDNNTDNKKYRCKLPNMKTRNKTIKKEIMTNGPVETTMMVYEDFMNYREGVYHHVDGKFLGGHAIKLVGWGQTEEGVKYWIMANSWGEGWGEQGYFRIQEGNSDAGKSGFFCTPHSY